MPATNLLSLPVDILVLLPDHLHNIEDYTNVASTCRTLRRCMASAQPETILKLAVAQSKIFFRPSPLFLLAAVARELGNWARKSESNEAIFAASCLLGVDGLLDLAQKHCGLTMDRIRKLHQLRFDIINPVTNIMDQCVGNQWYSLPDFWNGGADDAYTIDAEPSETLFHLAIYGELFAPDLESYLENNTDSRRLSVDTRLEFVKYCIPDFATSACVGGGCKMPDGTIDPRREVHKKAGGPYDPESSTSSHQNNIALTWVINSSRWRPHWKTMRAQAGIEDFASDFVPEWWYGEDDSPEDWRQRLLETTMVCQGLEGLGMALPQFQPDWISKVKDWRAKIVQLQKSPEPVMVGRQATHEYPFLLGDLRVCASGYVGGS